MNNNMAKIAHYRKNSHCLLVKIVNGTVNPNINDINHKNEKLTNDIFCFDFSCELYPGHPTS